MIQSMNSLYEFPYPGIIKQRKKKSSELSGIKNKIFALIGFAVFFDGWTILNYRKRS